MSYKLPEIKEDDALNSLPPSKYSYFVEIKKGIGKCWSWEINIGLHFTLSQLYYIFVGLVNDGMSPLAAVEHIEKSMLNCSGYETFMKNIAGKGEWNGK